MAWLKASRLRGKKKLAIAVVIVCTFTLASALFLNYNRGYTTSTIDTTTSTIDTTSISVSSTFYANYPSVTYVTSSPPNSSQWLIVKSATTPISVLANNTGDIKEYISLSMLNKTKIGTFCMVVDASGGCSEFEQYMETGWYWSSSDEILYIHYVGGSYVQIKISSA